MNKTLKTAIIGMGRAGRFHLTSMKIIDGFDLKYVVDPDESKSNAIRLPPGAKHLSTIDEVLDDEEIDAIIVSSPTDYHYDYIIRSLNAGKHVFTEKPLGHGLKEVKECFDTAAENEKALHLGFQRRFDKNFIALKNNLATIAEVRMVRASSRDNPKPSYEYLQTSGNIFHDMLIHDFDMMLFLFGNKAPVSIHVYAKCYDEKIAAMDDYDTVVVSMQFEDGVIYTIDTSRTSVYGYDQRLEVFGSAGMLIAENELGSTLSIYSDIGIRQAPASYSFPQRYKAAYLDELVFFGESIRNGVLWNVTKEEAVLSHRIADACFVSAKENRIVKF